MMADPAFVQKLAIENLITLVGSLWYEAEQRGNRFFKVTHTLASTVIICVDCQWSGLVAFGINLFSSVPSAFCSGCFAIFCC